MVGRKRKIRPNFIVPQWIDDSDSDSDSHVGSPPAPKRITRVSDDSPGTPGPSHASNSLHVSRIVPEKKKKLII